MDRLFRFRMKVGGIGCINRLQLVSDLSIIVLKSFFHWELS